MIMLHSSECSAQHDSTYEHHQKRHNVEQSERGAKKGEQRATGNTSSHDGQSHHRTHTAKWANLVGLRQPTLVRHYSIPGTPQGVERPNLGRTTHRTGITRVADTTNMHSHHDILITWWWASPTYEGNEPHPRNPSGQPRNTSTIDAGHAH